MPSKTNTIGLKISFSKNMAFLLYIKYVCAHDVGGSLPCGSFDRLNRPQCGH